MNDQGEPSCQQGHLVVFVPLVNKDRQVQTKQYNLTIAGKSANSGPRHVNYDIITHCSPPQPNSIVTRMASYLYMHCISICPHYVKILYHPLSHKCIALSSERTEPRPRIACTRVDWSCGCWDTCIWGDTHTQIGLQTRLSDLLGWSVQKLSFEHLLNINTPNNTTAGDVSGYKVVGNKR